MPFAAVSDERLAEAKRLLDDEHLSFSEVTKRTGITYPTLRKYFGKQDPRPGGTKRATPRPKKVGPTDEQLVSTFTKIAVAPAIPAGLMLHCDYCATHFATTGPDAAVKLVELSQSNPALRGMLEAVYKWGEQAAWAGLLGMYFGVPIAHHLAPDFIYKYFMLLGLPPRGVPVQPHSHAPENGGQPVDTPYASMDTESLLRMAESMGFKVDFDDVTPPPENVFVIPESDVTEDDADAAEHPEPTVLDGSESAVTAEPAEATETVTPDQDANI